MRGYLAFGAAALGVASLFGSLTPPGDDGKADAERVVGPNAVPRAHEHDPALIIRRDAGGQFHMTAQVNGEDVRFVVDTGADVVALTVEDAQRLGLGADPDQFEAIGQSASGTAYGAVLNLERLEIDGHELVDVEAVVVDGLQTNLLGQSALRRLGRVELQRDTMVIRAPA